MSNVVNNLLLNLDISALFSSILPLVPFIVIIFAIAFGFKLLKDWLVHSSIVNDPDTLGYYDKHGKYHHIRNSEFD